MIINAVHPDEFRIAIVEGQSLESFFIERRPQQSHR